MKIAHRIVVCGARGFKMGVSYKNFWSLNVDESVVTGLLRNFFKNKDIEIFMPLNAQMKDIDLVIMNVKNKKIITIQVKGSKAYEPTKKEIEKFKYGSTGWFFIKEEIIRDCSADYFIFLVYVINEREKDGRRHIEPHIITITPRNLYNLCKEKKILHKNYSFYIWVNQREKIAFDWRDMKTKGIIDLNSYLNGKGLNPILKELE